MSHLFSMPDWATQRIVSRQGKLLVHDDVPAVKTALIVIDMQNYFMLPGAPAEAPMARDIVGNINRCAQALRTAGGLVVWVRTLFTQEAHLTIPHFHHILMTEQRFETRCAHLAETADGSKLWHELDVQPEDLTVGKTRYSAFIQGASDLDGILRAKNIEAVAVTGTMTNACCESTARDAMMLNYRTTMIHDANASLRDDEHAAALINFNLFFGDVTDTAEFTSRF